MRRSPKSSLPRYSGDAAKGGVALIAEEACQLLGWGDVYRDENELYVRPEERTFALISELFVVEPAAVAASDKASLPRARNGHACKASMSL